MFTIVPLREGRAMLGGVLVNEAIEVLFQLAGYFCGSPRAGAIHKTLGALVGKAIDRLTQRRIGKLECVGDALEALAFDDFAYGLGTAEDARLFSLFHEVSKVERASSGKCSLSVRMRMIS